jgi:hypothetical protein
MASRRRERRYVSGVEPYLEAKVGIGSHLPKFSSAEHEAHKRLGTACPIVGFGGASDVANTG